MALHWLIAVLILAMATIGLSMVGMRDSPDKVAVFALHKSIGITILALMVLRLSWRLYAGAPPPMAGIPSLQQRLAGATHGALYVLLLMVPISGWMMHSASGFPLQWFGLFNLPNLVAANEVLQERAKTMHEFLFWLLAALALVHIAAAFYHHLFQGDATLLRMLPGRGVAQSEHARNAQDS